MIRASAPLTLEQAADYYRREYSRGDYYTGDRAAGAGTWQGRGAERLGLAGEVAPQDFAALLAGRSPRDGRQLVAPDTRSGKHRAAWDFQAAPHKSVSVVALVGGDECVLAAHLAAVRRAFEVLEDQALVKDRGRRLVPTRNLVIARFDHDASRTLDPHLHSHQVVMNLTERTAARGRRPAEWRALEPRGLFAAQSLATAVYHAELARELQALGYEVRADARGYVRIAGIPEEVLKTFSKRRFQILAEVARRGGSGSLADRQRAALHTRPPKNRDVDPAALRAAWRAEAARLGLDLAAHRRAADERLAASRSPQAPPRADPLAQARASAAWAVAHLAERQASFRMMDLETFALRHAAARGPGLDEIRAALAAHPGLIRGAEDRVTTEAALRLEQANLDRVRAGLLPAGPPVLAHPYRPAADQALGADQLRVVRHILESRQQLLGVEGKPGSGKTHALGAVRDAAEKAGWTVRGFAVSTGAVAQLREVGIEAATLKSLAAHPPDRPLPRQLWIVDEASLLGNRDASTALESAHLAGARLVLVGDRRQHHAVEAGAPWSAFQTAGLRPVQLDLIRRQKHTDLLAAVQLSAAGRAADAIRHLDARGHVVEIASTRDRHAAMVKEFVAAPRHTLMIAPSHAERRDLNFLARRELLAAGRIAPEAVTVPVTVSKGLTGAQRAEIRHYEVGDVVSYVQSAPTRGIRAGDTARVLAVDPEGHTLRVERHRDGAILDYDPRRLRGGDLARAETRDLAAGDRVRFRRADRVRGIPNGATATVREAAASGRLVLELEGRGGRTVTLPGRGGPQPLDYAYAVTSHAAQGSTVRRVLATFDTRHGVELVNRQQANVTLSRASHQLRVYTDDRAALPRAVDREARKSTALEVQPPPRSRHAPPPPARAAAERSVHQRATDAAGTRDHRPVRAARRAAEPRGGLAARPGPAPRGRPRARADRRADRARGARDPRPCPHPLREPRPQPRSERAEERPRHPFRAPDRPAPRRRGGRPGDARDPRGDRAAVQRARPLTDPAARRLILAAERWQQAASARTAPRTRLPGPPAPAPGHAGLRRGARATVAGLALDAVRATARDPSAPGAATGPEDPERRLVRLVKELGVRRALALLPPPLARAIQGIREIARLVAGLELDR
jgi:conjugative relaxase-like TrwC/TraI family protein